MHVYAAKGRNDVFLRIILISEYQDLINQQDEAGYTPLDYAYISGVPQIIHALEYRGAKRGAGLRQELQEKKKQISLILKFGIGLSTVGFLLYKANKQYGLLPSIQQYVRSKKQ